jgi:hypothetical protein
MANPNKARGTSWESAIVHYLNDELGHYKPDWRQLPGMQRHVNFLDPLNVRRQVQMGARDIGDVLAWPFIIEAKDVKAAAVPAWLRQARVEAVNAGADYGVVVHKTRHASPALGAVHFDVSTWTRVRLELGMTTRDFQELGQFTATVRGRDTSTWRLTTTLGVFAEILRLLREVRAAK